MTATPIALDWIREIADRLGLRDWAIKLADEPTVDDTAGELICVYGRKLATLKLAYNFNDLSPSEHRYIVVHELLHIHLEPLGQVLLNLTAHVGQSLYGLSRAHFTDATEYAVDALATVMAPSLPLPPAEGE